MQDHIHNWRETALILTSILFPAAGIWFIGKFLLVILPFSIFFLFLQRRIQVDNSFSRQNFSEGNDVAVNSTSK